MLINLLILELRGADGIDQMSSVKLDRTRKKQTNISAYETFINKTCKITFSWYVSKKLQWRDLTGPEKKVLFRDIDIPSPFPSLPRADQIQNIWKGLLDFMKVFSQSDLSVEELDHFESNVRVG